MHNKEPVPLEKKENEQENIEQGVEVRETHVMLDWIIYCW